MRAPLHSKGSRVPSSKPLLTPPRLSHVNAWDPRIPIIASCCCINLSYPNRTATVTAFKNGWH